MREDLKFIFEINETVKNLAEGFEINRTKAPDWILRATLKNIEETMQLVKMVEIEIIPRLTPEEAFMAGQVIGRMQSIYALITKAMVKSDKQV